MAQKMKYTDTVKEAITLALVELMKERELGQITIKDIVAKAGVGRSSFYRNFSSKEDILLAYLDYLLDATREERPFADENIRGYMISYFQAVKRHQELFCALQRSGLLYLLYHQTCQSVKHSVAYFHLYRNPYQAAFFSGAGTSVVIQWIENDFRETEEDLADMFIYLMDGHHREKRAGCMEI